MANRLRLGTRGSPLARWQAEFVAARLLERGVDVELHWIETRGDVYAGPLSAGAGIGVFTKEIQRALLSKTVDLAVHSLKDLPTEPVPGLCLAAVPPRESCGDVLISSTARTLEQLPAGARVGTGSARRRAQLLHLRPDLKMLEIRGNVETRLRKLDAGEYDAIVLAEAGLKRLGLLDRIGYAFPLHVMLPAVGQGALGIECREEDGVTQEALAGLDDPTTHQAVNAERALLYHLRGGCLAPVGAWGRVQDNRLRLDGVVLPPDGSRRLAAAADGPLDEASRVGQRVAEQLLEQGAAELIAAARS